jgi:hypothetical protein
MAQTPDEEIQTLLKLKAAMDKQPTDLVDKSRIDDPTVAIEHTLVGFIEETFKSLKEDFSFRKDLKEEIRNRIAGGSLNDNSLITLLINEGTLVNDKISKTLGPFTQLSVAKKNAEAKQLESVGDPSQLKKLNGETSKEIQQGLASLNMILQKVVPKNKLAPTSTDLDDGDGERVMPEFSVQPDEEFPVQQIDEIPEINL